MAIVPRRIWKLMSPADQALHQPDDRAEILFQPPKKPEIPESETKIPKGELHEQRTFNTWLNLRRLERKLWPVNPRSDKASTIRAGHPDYSIWLLNRSLLLEMKGPDGVFSQQQLAAIRLLDELGHDVHIITSADAGIKLVQKFL